MLQKVYRTTLKECMYNKVFFFIVCFEIGMSCLAGMTAHGKTMDIPLMTGVWPLYFGTAFVLLSIFEYVNHSMSRIADSKGAFDLEKCAQIEAWKFLFGKLLAYITIAVVLQLICTLICLIKLFTYYHSYLPEDSFHVVRTILYKLLFGGLPVTLLIITFTMTSMIITQSIIPSAFIIVGNLLFTFCDLLQVNQWLIPLYQMRRLCTQSTPLYTQAIPIPVAVFVYGAILLLLSLLMFFMTERKLRRNVK